MERAFMKTWKLQKYSDTIAKRTRYLKKQKFKNIFLSPCIYIRQIHIYQGSRADNGNASFKISIWLSNM